MSGKLWDNYNATKAYDGYFTNDNKLRKHAQIISSILERYGKDKLQEIEKAIMVANLGFNPMNNGESIIINVPPLTEERRKDLAKLAKSESEKD